MNIPILEAPIRYWRCPSCGLTDRTQIAVPHTQFHECPAMSNAGIPLVEVADPDAKAKARHIIVPNGGTPSIRTERLDGSNDVTVFPSPAVATTTT